MALTDPLGSNILIGGVGGSSTLGANAGVVIQGASHSNTYLGATAGDKTTTGFENVCVGYNADISAVGGDNQIVIGNNVSGSGDDRVVIGNDSGTYYLDYTAGSQSWTQTSDVRIKRDIEDGNLGLSFINELRPVTYRHKPRSEYPESWNEYNKDITEASEDKYYGLVAKEVKEAMDKVGGDYFSGWKEDYDGRQGVGFASFVIPLIKAVQELSEKVSKLENKE